MNEFKTGLRAIRLMWPLFVLMAVLFAVMELFSSQSSLLGAKVVAFSFLVLIVHQTILTGHFEFELSLKSSTSPNLFSLRFFGLLLLIAWFPSIAGAVLGASLLDDPNAFGQLPILVFAVFPLWISLTFFGTSIPRYVFRKLNEGEADSLNTVRSIWLYTGGRLLFWNALYFVLAILLLLALGLFGRSAFGATIPYYGIGADIVMDAFSCVSLALTAAVLSHAHLKKYGLAPQGLIDRL